MKKVEEFARLKGHVRKRRISVIPRRMIFIYVMWRRSSEDTGLLRMRWKVYYFCAGVGDRGCGGELFTLSSCDCWPPQGAGRGEFFFFGRGSYLRDPYKPRDEMQRWWRDVVRGTESSLTHTGSFSWQCLEQLTEGENFFWRVWEKDNGLKQK